MLVTEVARWDDGGAGYAGLNCWNSVVEGSEDSERRVKAVCLKLDSSKYWKAVSCGQGEHLHLQD